MSVRSPTPTQSGDEGAPEASGRIHEAAGMRPRNAAIRRFGGAAVTERVCAAKEFASIACRNIEFAPVPRALRAGGRYAVGGSLKSVRSHGPTLRIDCKTIQGIRALHSASPRRSKGGAVLHGGWAVALLLFATLMLASTPGLAGQGHGMHAHDMPAHDAVAAPDAPGAQLDAGTDGRAPVVAICMRVAAGAAAMVAAAPDQHQHAHHPYGSHDAGCKRMSSCVSCVSVIASTFEAMPVPYAVRSVRKASNAVIPAGVPPAKLQRPPRSLS